MDTTTFIAIITALAALIGASSPIIITLIKSTKDERQSSKGILLPDNVVLHHPKPQIQWLFVFSFAVVGGVVGFGLAKFFSGPQTGNPPVSTATIPVEANTSAPTGTSGPDILFNEDFEDGKAQKITHISGDWQIVTDETGNKVYEIDNLLSPDFPGIFFGDASWGDYKIRLRVRMLSNTARWSIVSFRQDEINRNQYVASLDSQSVALNYTDKYSYEWNVITNRDYSLSKDQWHWVSIEAKGTEIKISVDDVVLINTDDTRYKNGTIEIGVGQYTHAQYDDIQVTSLNK